MNLGTHNDCDGSFFNLDQHLDDIAPRIYTQAPPDEEMQDCQPIGVDAGRYEAIRESDLHDQMEAEDSRIRHSDWHGDPEDLQTPEDAIEVERNEELIEGIDETHVPIPPEYEDLSHFHDEWEADIVRYQGELLDVNKVTDIAVKVLFDRCDNSKDPLCKFRCRWCVEFFEKGNRADIRQKTSIQTKNGVLLNTKYKNTALITNHMKNPVHLAAKKHLFLVAKQKLQDQHAEIREAYESSDQNYYKATINMFKLVYTEAIINTPFYRHAELANLARDIGVKIGTHHANEKAAKTITQFISLEMHTILIKHLVAQDLPFSIIVDGNTDKHNIPYLIVYIHTLENNRPIAYFYRIIELNKGESSEAMFNALIECVKADTTETIDFFGFFKRRLIALISDGASNMVSPGVSLYARLKSFANEKLISIHCMAHRLDLAVQWAVEKDKSFSYFNKFNSILNSLYTFYQSRGSKRFQHLSETASDLGIELKRLKYWFNVRWSASHYAAVRSVEDDYVALYKDLEAISVDRSFTIKTRNKALALFNKIRDKSFILALKFFKDFLYLFKILSEDLQARTGLLIGSNKLILTARNSRSSGEQATSFEYFFR